MEKKKYIALVLTLLLPGLGYIYLGKKMLFGLFLLVAGISEFAWRFTTEPNGFELNAFLIATAVGYWGAILLDTWYTAEGVIPEQKPASAKPHDKPEHPAA